MFINHDFGAKAANLGMTYWGNGLAPDKRACRGEPDQIHCCKGMSKPSDCVTAVFVNRRNAI
jgi:hypothetical protein